MELFTLSGTAMRVSIIKDGILYDHSMLTIMRLSIIASLGKQGEDQNVKHVTGLGRLVKIYQQKN